MNRRTHAGAFRAVCCRVRSRPRAAIIRLAWALAASVGSTAAAQPASGPLRVHPDNPRYFANAQGQAVYLTGSHTWSNLQDAWTQSYNVIFDFDAYLDFLQAYNHNFIRLWRWELPQFRYDIEGEVRFSAPHPWLRIGGGGPGPVGGAPRYRYVWGDWIGPVTWDHLPEDPFDPPTGVFDLSQFDPAYFQRLRERCVAAGERGIYVSIMLFEGHGLQFTVEGWNSHPFHLPNNINSVDGDANNDGMGVETQTLTHPAALAVQEAYVRQVIDTVNDLDNIFYEIANESHTGSLDWQNHMANYVMAYEQTKPKQHLVWISSPFPYPGEGIWTSAAQVVSPLNFSAQGSYGDNPPAANGSKIVIADSDHIFGCGGYAGWVWKSFTRGLHPIYMDSYYADTPFCPPPDESIRLNMGYTRSYALRMNLAQAAPANGVASTGYCLAEPGVRYLIYAPSGGSMTVDLSSASGTFTLEWFNPNAGTTLAGGTVSGGVVRTLTPPFSGHAVAFLENPDDPTPGPGGGIVIGGEGSAGSGNAHEAEGASQHNTSDSNLPAVNGDGSDASGASPADNDGSGSQQVAPRAKDDAAALPLIDAVLKVIHHWSGSAVAACHSHDPCPGDFNGDGFVDHRDLVEAMQVSTAGK